MSNKVKSPLMKKAPTYSLRASIISILIGLLTGAVVILIVGAFHPLISLKGAWDGIRLVLFGVLLYDSLSGMRTGPSANGTYFVMREVERNERDAIQ